MNAQYGFGSHKKNRLFGTNFNGSIKSSELLYSKFNNTDKTSLGIDQLIMNERELMGPVFTEFDSIGRLTVISSAIYRKNDVDFIKKNATMFDYTKNNYDALIEIEDTLEFNYPVYNYFLMKKLDCIRSTVNRSYDKKSNLNSKKDSLSRIFERHTYILNEKGQIIKESNHYLLKEFNRNADFEDLESYENDYEIQFIYNDLDRINKQLISAGKGPGKRNFMYGAENSRIPFHAMGTESGFCEDLHFSYQYDAKDRITDIVFFGCNDTLAYEKYTYNDNLGYISKIRKYVGGVGGSFQITKTTDYYYDKYANVIK